MKDRILLFLKGLAMGAADIVPGVSGGTIAFISGIYEELLNSIKSVDLEALKLLISFQLNAFWQKINGNFLATLLLGIATSVLFIVDLIVYLLANHPIWLWAFFFGLIIASAWLVAKQVKKWSVGAVISFIVGTAIAYYITTIQTPAADSASLPYIFLCGTIAICAMILPGISGSFILLLMGAYETVIGTLKSLKDAVLQFDFDTIKEKLLIVVTFAIGCLVGLIAFSRVLTWLFKHFHDLLVAALIGFLLGSLNKIWPWKTVIQELTEKHKIYGNVSPLEFESVTGSPAHLIGAIVMVVTGFALVYGLELISGKKENETLSSN